MLLPFGPMNSLGTFQVSANWGISTQCSFFVNAFGMLEPFDHLPNTTWSPPVVQNMADKTLETAMVVVVWKIHFVTCFCWCFPISRIREAFAGYQRHARACAAGDEATSRDRTLGLLKCIIVICNVILQWQPWQRLKSETWNTWNGCCNGVNINEYINVDSWLQESSRSNEFQATY